MRPLFSLVTPILLFAAVHMAQVEPYVLYQIKSSVSGSVVESKWTMEGKEVKNEPVILIDNIQESIRIKSLRAKKSSLIKTIKIEQKNLQNLKKIKEIKKRNYERIKNLSTKSQSEKDRRLSEYLNANTLYLNQLAKIENLKIQLADIEENIGILQDQISKKRIILSGYIYKIYPKRGDFVSPGTPLAETADTSRGKITIYLDKEELKKLGKNSIYIDSKPRNVEILSVKKIPDKVHITQYEVQILIPEPEIFGNLVKVEIK